MTMAFLFFLLVFILYVTLSVAWPRLAGGAVYSPTPRSEIKLAMEMAEVGPHDTLYDLGCGTGVVLAEAKKRGAKVVGVEIEPLRWFISKLRVRGSKVILGNMFNVPLNEATIVFLFQYPDVNMRLKGKLERELKPRTKVISYMWEIEGWKPAKMIKNIYLYVIGNDENNEYQALKRKSIKLSEIKKERL